MNDFHTTPKKNTRKLTTKEKWVLIVTIIVAVIVAVTVSSFIKSFFT